MNISPLARLIAGMTAIGLFLVAFALRDKSIEQRGETKALAKVERATNEAVAKAHRAGKRSQSGSGVLNPYYRD